ncbi:MAG: hypothetical protein HQL94_03615 [Magnetococcales bacterium]|nr:hypothetical protein [Magnetococcales bacterium]MBF0440252.1 hypothetical protein [Magnetococcales bacterium]
MADRDLYTKEQLAKIRETLKESLGEHAKQALDNLEHRFVPATELPEDDLPRGTGIIRGRAGDDDEKKSTVDVEGIIHEGRLKKMLDSLDKIQDDPNQVRTMVAEILRHRDVKAFHMVTAMSKVTKDVELVNALARAIVSNKGVNPLIDGMRYATISPEAIKALAMGVAEQGTVNHIIRAIATSPPNLPEAEIIWAMEVMGRGSMEQMLEAIKLLSSDSPGSTILATGIVNRKEVAIEPLVRALTATKDNPHATTILAVALTKLGEVSTWVTLLEKYVSDDSDAGEILMSKLVKRSLDAPNLPKMMAKAARFVSGDSMAGKILAMGIVEQKDPDQMEAAYLRINHPVGKQMLAVGISNKMSSIKAMRLLGGDYFKLSKMQAVAAAATKEAQQRYHWILLNMLDEDLEEKKPVSAKEALVKGLKAT